MDKQIVTDYKVLKVNKRKLCFKTEGFKYKIKYKSNKLSYFKIKATQKHIKYYKKERGCWRYLSFKKKRFFFNINEDISKILEEKNVTNFIYKNFILISKEVIINRKLSSRISYHYNSKGYLLEKKARGANDWNSIVYTYKYYYE